MSNKSFVLSCFLFLSIVFAAAFGVYLIESNKQAELENISCPSVMADVIASAQGDVYNTAEYTDEVAPESQYVAMYSVYGDLLTEPVYEPVTADLQDEQENLALQRSAWDAYTEIIPLEQRRMVKKFNLFTDGESNTLAAVDQRKEDPSEWVLEIDLADLEDKNALYFTLVHEHAHILTLNASQAAPDREVVNDPYNLELIEEKDDVCNTFFTGLGCSYKRSYVNAFYERFWAPELYAKWLEADALQYDTDDLIPYYDALYAFYKSHPDQFLDDYSVTHPDEDIAEAFAYFVFSPKPAGETVKEQKILFFYEYPELIELRGYILSKVCHQ